MAFSYQELFCGGKTFCCCLPVRIGVIIMSLLGMLLGGVLSIVLWFEVASTDMTSGERVGFVVAGLVETLLFAASVLGFVGAIVRKQLFVLIYAYFIYVHFLLNIGVAGYLLYLVTRFSTSAAVKACQETIQDQQAKVQCTGLLKVARGVYIFIAAIVLLVELYIALVAARYLNQVKVEKRSARASRTHNKEAFALVSKGKGRYSSLPGEQDRDIPSPSFPMDFEQEFDPYEGIREPIQEIPRSLHPEEVGYGGGFWTHSEISTEEKARLKQKDIDTEMEAMHGAGEETASQGSDIKSRSGPPPFPDILPRYSLSDPPRGPTLG